MLKLLKLLICCCLEDFTSLSKSIERGIPRETPSGKFYQIEGGQVKFLDGFNARRPVIIHRHLHRGSKVYLHSTFAYIIFFS